MDVLKLTLASVLLFSSAVWAGGEDYEPDYHEIAVKEQAKKLCNSTDEYIATLRFLRSNKDMNYTEKTSRLIAEKVARGCDGAAERFSQILILLKTIGLSDRSALAMALDFSSQTPDVQKNFSEIFTRAFLSEFFDYNYNTAYRIAIELSKNYRGEPAQVREDFVELAHYCKDGKTLDLPGTLCSEYTIRLVRLSEYFPDGIRKPFYSLFTTLREKPEFTLDMKTALDVTYNVLKNGPRAPENFLSAYKYAMEKNGLDLDRKQSLAFALRMADRSFIGGDQPPFIPAVNVKPPVEAHADHP